MAGGQVEILRIPWVDVSGNILQGTVEFYNAESTTPREVFADYGMTSSLGISGTIGVDGTFPCFINGETFYKLVIKDVNGATIKTYDGLSSQTITDTSGYFRLDGSRKMTGDLDLNGYDLIDVGDIQITNDKNIFINHGSAYIPGATDMIVLGDADSKVRMYVLNGDTHIAGDSDIITFNDSLVTINTDIVGTSSIDAQLLTSREIEISDTATITNLIATTGTFGEINATTINVDNVEITNILNENIECDNLLVSTSMKVSTSLDMDNNKIINLTNGSESGDAVNYSQLSEHTSASNPHSGSALNSDLTNHINKLVIGDGVHGTGTAAFYTQRTDVRTTGDASDWYLPTEKAVRYAIEHSGWHDYDDATTINNILATITPNGWSNSQIPNGYICTQFVGAVLCYIYLIPYTIGDRHWNFAAAKVSDGSWYASLMQKYDEFGREDWGANLYINSGKRLNYAIAEIAQSTYLTN